MTEPQKTDRENQETEAAEAKRKEGAGTVPNVTPGKPDGELVEALHDLEEEKGDWSKDR
jgi:hypothetical protein